MMKLHSIMNIDRPILDNLCSLEKSRDEYWNNRDPIVNDRLLWRAQTFRHLVHLLPQQSILEVGSGQGSFTRRLLEVSRKENPITSITFQPNLSRPEDLPPIIEWIDLNSDSDMLSDRQFDFIVVMELLEKRNCSLLLQNILDLLKPGGQVVFYVSNPWNPVLKIQRFIAQLFGQSVSRRLLNRSELYELISELGYIRTFAVYNDFVYPPLNTSLIWMLRNLSILLENASCVQTLAGSILIHAQKPPRLVPRPQLSLAEHKQLKKSISIVIPCHNEDMNIETLINQLRIFYDDYIHEIIPVDDNSTDNTGEILKRLTLEDSRIKPVFRSPPNGVGRAIAEGYRSATGKYILSMDCDFQHLLPEIRDLFDAAVEGYDVVIGSRFSRHSVLLNYPFAKIFVNRGFHSLAQILFRRKFRDVTNNLKLMRREVVEKLELTQPGFAVNAETGLQPILMGYSFKEVPISWINRTPDMGISSFRLIKVGGGYWQVLFRLWLKQAFGGI